MRNLLVLVVVAATAGGCSRSLTRQEATALITKSAMFSTEATVNTLSLVLGESCSKSWPESGAGIYSEGDTLGITTRSRKQYSLAAVGAGNAPKVCRDAANVHAPGFDGPDAVFEWTDHRLTPKAISAGISGPLKDIPWIRRVLLEITGIVRDSETLASAEFTWTLRPVDLARTFGVPEPPAKAGRAHIRLYDDGWRLMGLSGVQ